MTPATLAPMKTVQLWLLNKVLLLAYLSAVGFLLVTVVCVLDGSAIPQPERSDTGCGLALGLNRYAGDGGNTAAGFPLFVEQAANSSPEFVDAPIINIMPWYIRYEGDTEPHWYGELGSSVFNECAVSRCTLVDDLNQSHAVLISQNYLATFIRHFQPPARTNLSQKWIFYSWEPPQLFDVKPEFQRAFNATFTYMSKSNAYRPYGRLMARAKDGNESNYDVSEQEWMSKKKVVWLQSNCFTPSGRESYVSELAKHIDVTKYGKCGQNECPQDKQCRPFLSTYYKFYLAFENSLCEEYATEKVFGVLETSMIPIVYGLYDYKSNLPPNSVIDVRDFNSPKELADYLDVVANNRTLFDSFHQWKQLYTVKRNLMSDATCRLCEHLHRTRDDPPTTVKLDEFWSNESLCTTKENFLPTVGVELPATPQ